MSNWNDVKDWADDKAAGPYDYGIGQRVLAMIAEYDRLIAILAQQKSRRADDDECLSLATQSIDELRKDAERYRWLRRTEDWEYRSSLTDHIVIGSHGGVINNTGEALDNVIDAAMGKGEQS